MTTTSSANQEWRDIPGFEGAYQASTLGEIRSLDRTVETITADGVYYARTYKGVVLRQSASGSTKVYKKVTLSINGITSRELVHRLIAMTYIEQQDPRKTEVNHKNGNGSDSRVENLEWITPEENKEHAYRIGKLDYHRPARKNSVSQVPGVVRLRGKWQASITIHGRKTYLGLFDEVEDAIKARKQAEANYDKGKTTAIR